MRFKRDLIENALSQSNGNQNRAASILKISRQALGYQIRELGILAAKPMSRTEERRVAKPSRNASPRLRRA